LTSPNAGLLPISFVPPGRGSGKGKQQQSGFDAGDQRRLPNVLGTGAEHPSTRKSTRKRDVDTDLLHRSSSKLIFAPFQAAQPSDSLLQSCDLRSTFRSWHTAKSDAGRPLLQPVARGIGGGLTRGDCVFSLFLIPSLVTSYHRSLFLGAIAAVKHLRHQSLGFLPFTALFPWCLHRRVPVLVDTPPGVSGSSGPYQAKPRYLKSLLAARRRTAVHHKASSTLVPPCRSPTRLDQR
jgi:hypothetical protein